MSMFYFLVFVGLCAIGLIWLATRSGSASVPNPPRRRHTICARRVSIRCCTVTPICISITGGISGNPRRMHATEDHLGEARWGGETFLAKKIESDDEVEAEQDATGVTMPAIKYEPTEPGLQLNFQALNRRPGSSRQAGLQSACRIAKPHTESAASSTRKV